MAIYTYIFSVEYTYRRVNFPTKTIRLKYPYFSQLTLQRFKILSKLSTYCFNVVATKIKKRIRQKEFYNL